MGMTPTPAPLLVLAGTARPDRVRPDMPAFDLVNDFPKPPSYLGHEAKKMWKEVGPQLVAAGVLQVVDLYPLEQLCYTWQRFRTSAKAGAAITAADNAALRTMFSEFGMTPAARRRVAASKAIPTEGAANRFAGHGKRRA